MKANTHVGVTALAIGLVLGAVGGRLVWAQTAENRTVLLTNDLVGIDGYEIRMWRTQLGPGAVGAKHVHPGTECIYVLDGALNLDEAGKPVNIKAGTAHCVAPKTVLVPRNASSTEPYNSLVVMVTPKGQPISIPVP
jgi:quercetin dioxygenase-like cupin family protein